MIIDQWSCTILLPSSNIIWTDVFIGLVKAIAIIVVLLLFSQSHKSKNMFKYLVVHSGATAISAETCFIYVHHFHWWHSTVDYQLCTEAGWCSTLCLHCQNKHCRLCSLGYQKCNCLCCCSRIHGNWYTQVQHCDY